MAYQSLNTLKEWFRKGLKPLSQQFWDWMDSFYHKSENIPAAKVEGLGDLLDEKVSDAPKNGNPHARQDGDWVEVETGGGGSENDKGWFPTAAALRIAHPVGENGWYSIVGETDTVWTWDEDTPDWVDTGGSNTPGTTDHSQLSNRDAADAHPLSAITPAAGNAKKLVIVDADGNILGYSTFDFDQIFQFGDMDVSDWLNGEKRLALISNDNGEAKLEDAAALRDIFAPPGVDAQLLNQSDWINEKKTISGENYRGELGNAGQQRPLAEGVYICESSTPGNEGVGNGSSTWVRNRAVDVLDPDNASQDSTICDKLNPMRTGGNTDDGWDLVTNTKVLTVPSKWGTWWKDTGGYMYFCYAISGTNSYWWRNGTPQAIQAPINTTSHPTLTANLLAHDFTAGVYTDQTGDETSYWDQYFYNAATRVYFKKVSSTQWEKLR